MKVALIGDSLWLTHEALLLRHLVFGLSDEFVRVVPVFPADAGPDEMPGVTERISYRPSRFDWMTGLRVARLTAALREVDANLIHLLDGRLAAPAARLAAKRELPLVVSCWSADQLAHVRRATNDSAFAIVPMPSVAEHADGIEHQLVRPGVMRREQNVPPLNQADRSLCVLVMVEAQMAGAVPAFMEGLARVRPDLPQLQIFVYPVECEAHRVWMAASKLNLLSQLSMVGPEVGTQELLMRVDAVVLPQPVRRAWTLPLAAMAAERPVIAPLSPLADYMIAGNTYEQVSNPTDPAAWADVLSSLVRRPDHYTSIGRSARKYVQEHHGIGRYVNDVLAVYKEAIGEPIKFDSNV